MEHILSLETNSFPAGQHISYILWNPKDYYRVYKNPLLDPNVCLMNQIYAHMLLPYIISPPFMFPD